jgi:hypothetical protein
MNITKFYAATLVLRGITTVALPLFVGNYWLLHITAALFGLFFPTTFIFIQLVLLRLIPLERFTTAYGRILLCEGIGKRLGQQLAG